MIELFSSTCPKPRVHNLTESIERRMPPYKHCLRSNMTCTWERLRVVTQYSIAPWQSLLLGLRDSENSAFTDGYSCSYRGKVADCKQETVIGHYPAMVWANHRRVRAVQRVCLTGTARMDKRLVNGCVDIDFHIQIASFPRSCLQEIQSAVYCSLELSREREMRHN